MGARALTHVKAKPTGFEPLGLRFGKHAEKIADIIKELNVGGGIGSGGSSNGRLINRDDLVYFF